MNSLKAYVRSLLKTLIHLCTGKCEIERLVSKEQHDAAMSVAFSCSLCHSKRLTTYKTLVFTFKKFSPSAAVSNVIEVKKMKREPLLVANLTHCFEDLGTINAFVRGLEKDIKTTFDDANTQHRALLVEFWTALMPDMRVPTFNGDTEGSEDWTLVGFQGKKPQTDFRGMGLLGLKQLHWFANKRWQRARECLREANHPKRYFPFAATGINITAFMMELVRDTRFHMRFMENAESTYIHGNGSKEDEEEEERGEDVPLLGPKNGTNKDSDDSTWKSVGPEKYGNEEEFYMTYCDFYSAFVALWVKRDPENIMAFPAVFAEFKEAVLRNKLFCKIE
jgi:hypothetical protein